MSSGRLFGFVTSAFGFALTPMQAVAATTGSGFGLTDLGSLAAVAISLGTLVTTLVTTRSKTQREQREELKAAIEKLLDFRNDFNTRQGTFASEQEREFFSTSLNTRRSIYLEWAERLAHQLPYVTPAEWIVLGSEHMSDSNFARAEKTFEQAVQAARSSSAVTQTSALRQVAWAQMMLGPARWADARKSYANAVSNLKNRIDPYSLYAVALTYRYWAEVEFAAGNLTECRQRLADALGVAASMPVWFDYRGFETRRCALDLTTLAGAYAATGDLAAARDALTAGAESVAPLGDPLSAEVLAQVLVRRVGLEIAAGDGAAAHAFAAQAYAALGHLPPDSVTRHQGAGELAALIPDAAVRD